MGLTKAQATARLQEITTADQLRKLIRELDTTGTGTTTLLWSGAAGEHEIETKTRIHAQDIAEGLQQSDSRIRTFATTEAGKFLNLDRTSKDFNQHLDGKLKSLFGSDQAVKEFLYGSSDPNTKKRIPNGVWDDVSKKFISEAKGDVRLIVGGAGWDRIFAQTELRGLLDNPAITSIEGIPIDGLRQLEKSQGFNSVLRALTAVSDVNAGMIRIRVDANGRPILGIDGKYSIDATDYMRMSQSSSPIPLGMRAMVDYIPRERQLRHIQAIDDIRRVNLS
ncbi:MAG: hypothetical protein ACK587_14370, partial [Cyanobacteriota bacterium]